MNTTRYASKDYRDQPDDFDGKYYTVAGSSVRRDKTGEVIMTTHEELDGAMIAAQPPYTCPACDHTPFASIVMLNDHIAAQTNNVHPRISATYWHWAAFNEGTLTPEAIGRTLVQFTLVDEDGNTDLIHEFRAGKEAVMYHRDGRLPVAEVMDLSNPVVRVCVR